MPHTPAPWRIENDNYGVRRIWDRRDYDICAVQGDGSIPEDEEMANAHLIVKAPELLRTCKELLAAHDALSEEIPFGEKREHANRRMQLDGVKMGYASRARAAIAEAEGR